MNENEADKKYRLQPYMPAFFMLLTLAVYYSQASSYSIYVILSFSIYGMCLLLTAKNISFANPKVVLLLFIIIALSLMTGFLNNSLKDAVMASSSLILPFFMAGTDIEDDKINKACWMCFIVTMISALLWGRSLMFQESNTNSMGFLMFMGFGSLIILFCSGKRNLIVITGILLSLFILYWSDSRNIMISFVLVVFIAVLQRLVSRKWILRLLYIAVLAYVVFYPYILSYAMKNESFMDLFSKISFEYFNKRWGIANRYYIYENVYNSIKSNTMNFLIGTGAQYHHSHNGYYQAVYMYGIFGTIGIGALCVYLFEMAIKLITENGDGFIFGVFTVLLGVFMQQAADVYLFGCKSCTVIVCAYMAFIVNRYYKFKKDNMLLPQLNIEES